MYVPFQGVAGLRDAGFGGDEGEEKFQTTRQDKVGLELHTLSLPEIHCRHHHSMRHL